MRNGALICGALILAVIGVLVMRNAGNASPAPATEPSGDPFFPVWYPGSPTGGVWRHNGTEHQWCATSEDFQHTRHRYPQGIGSNLTAVIHHGFASLAKGPQVDREWYIADPSNVMW